MVPQKLHDKADDALVFVACCSGSTLVATTTGDVGASTCVLVTCSGVVGVSSGVHSVGGGVSVCVFCCSGSTLAATTTGDVGVSSRRFGTCGGVVGVSSGGHGVSGGVSVCVAFARLVSGSLSWFGKGLTTPQILGRLGQRDLCTLNPCSLANGFPFCVVEVAQYSQTKGDAGANGGVFGSGVSCATCVFLLKVSATGEGGVGSCVVVGVVVSSVVEVFVCDGVGGGGESLVFVSSCGAG